MQNKKYKTFFAIILLLISMFYILNMQTFASYNENGLLTMGQEMSAKFMNSNTSSTTKSAMGKYVASGIFGQTCASKCGADPDTLSCINRNATDCAEAKTYYENNQAYSSYASAGLREQDKSSGRITAAMEAFNENAHYVYSFLMGFGCLTALLVFIIIFIRITWLPEHATQRRKAMEDIVTSGISVILLGGFWLVIGVFQSTFNRFWESYTVFSKDWKTAANIFLVEYKGLIVGFLGIATLTALLMFIKALTGVVVAGNSPQQKTAKMTQVLYTGLASAGLGGLTIFAGLFWNMLR